MDTGALRFFVSKQRFGLTFEQAEPIAVEITESAGRIWRALDLPVETLRVEQAGPMHTVILAETRLPASGKPAEGFYHRARIHAFADSPLVQIDYFVANTDSRPRDHRQIDRLEAQVSGAGGRRSLRGAGPQVSPPRCRSDRH